MNTYIRTSNIFVLLSIMLIFVLASCSSNPSDSQNSFSDQIPFIMQAISQDADIFDVSGMDDNGVQSPAGEENQLAKTNGPLDVIRFGRFGHFALDTVLVEFETDSTATATVFHTLNGEFKILAKDTSGGGQGATIISKKMTNSIVRKVKLIKKKNASAENDSANVRSNWKITQVSLAVGSSENPTVAIEQLRISSPGLNGDLVVTDPLATFLDRKSGIPEFSRNDTIKIYATISNTNNFPPEPGETVLLRHKMHRFSARSRKTLRDDGVYPDEVADDGVFSGFFVKQNLFGVRHSALDVIDNGTIYDDSAPYNSVFWALPYRNRIR